MGLLTKLVLLPLAPVTGVVWLAGQLEELAWQEMNNPAQLHEQLRALQAAYENGELTDEELEAAEDAVLARLEALDASAS
jgi:hypothetical protein